MLEMGMVRKANEATQSAGIDVEQVNARAAGRVGAVEECKRLGWA